MISVRPGVQLSFPFMREARFQRATRPWRLLAPTKHGIREDLLARGLKCGTTEFKAAYHKDFRAKFPQDFKIQHAKCTLTRARKSGNPARIKRAEKKIEALT